MKFKSLKTIFAGLIILVSSAANAGLIEINESFENIAAGSTNTQSYHLVNFLTESLDPNIVGEGSLILELFNSDTDGDNQNEFLEIYMDNFLILTANSSNTSPLITANQLSGTFIINLSNAMLSTILSDGKITWGFRGFGVADLGPNSPFSGYADERVNIKLTYSTVDVPEPSTLAIFALGMIGLASRRLKKQS